jgi:hypothetical protein
VTSCVRRRYSGTGNQAANLFSYDRVVQTNDRVGRMCLVRCTLVSFPTLKRKSTKRALFVERPIAPPSNNMDVNKAWRIKLAEIGSPVRRHIVIPNEAPEHAPAEPTRPAPAKEPEKEPA